MDAEFWLSRGCRYMNDKSLLLRDAYTWSRIVGKRDDWLGFVSVGGSPNVGPGVPPGDLVQHHQPGQWY